MKKIVLSLFSLVCTTILYSQSYLLIVKQGSVLIEDELIEPGRLIIIDTVADLYVIDPSLVLVKHNNTIKELTSGRHYSVTEIANEFEDGLSFTTDFLDMLLNQDFTPPDEHGITTRGENERDKWYYSPMDSLIAVSDSIEFIIGNSESEVSSPIKIWREGSSDTTFLSLNSETLTIALPNSPGSYFWSYRVINGNQESTFQNIFIVPSQSAKEEYKRNILNYQDQIKRFSNGMYDFLLSAYLHKYQLYYNLANK